MTNATVVINVVGLSGKTLPRLPALRGFASRHGSRKIRPVFPALTCSAQSTYLTGLPPSEHGIVGNGWYFPDQAQVLFWRQANSLVAGEKVWEAGRRLAQENRFTCANLFWWYNMYSSVDYSLTPRPIYRTDGRKLPDVYSEPSALREELQRKLGVFPLFHFWGPASDIRSTRWIAEASKEVFLRHRPSLSLIYLPHLDYCLQREGPNGPSLDRECGELNIVLEDLISFFRSFNTQLVFLSEYGINEVSGAIPINQELRKRGWIRVRDECGEDHLDPGASPAFAVADHQIAHVYVKDAGNLRWVRRLIEALPGVERVLDREAQREWGIAHPRSGDLLAVAQVDRWFSYSYWLEERRAPDYARTVDIHRKPGYDPVELFVDPKIRFPRLKVAGKLLAKSLGMRTLMDLVPLDDSKVRGSHGRSDVPEEFWPMMLTERTDLLPAGDGWIECTEVRNLLLRHVFELRERTRWGAIVNEA